jgi:4-diphosphocytidyl-2-C-methyl-D-erythritol kinase
MTILTEIARAKVNLTLRVLGRRADGFHDLDSLVAFADCADRLTLEAGEALGLTTTGPGAHECGDSGDNLVIKVARLLAEKIPNLKTGHFTLEKHLPVAAGIGGGSADAAAAMRLLANLNGLAVDDPRLSDVARATGADIPVCLPSRACVMTGVGDNLWMLDLPRLPCVMVNPRVAVATKDVFAALGLKNSELLAGFTDVISADDWPDGNASFDDWVAALTNSNNDLERPALKVEPVIAGVLDTLREARGAKLARMSGSGGTCFAIFENDPDARAAADGIAKVKTGWWVHAGSLS